MKLINSQKPDTIYKKGETYMRISEIIIGIILIATIISGCLSDKESQTATPVPTSISTGDASNIRVNSDAGVTITAEYLGNNIFDIKIDTHSGSLDYDMVQLSYIRDNKGNIIKPDSWKGGIGGHHIEGTLKFQKFDDNNGFELIIQDIAGVKERVLKW